MRPMSERKSGPANITKIFSTNDSTLKTFAEIVANKSSSDMLHLLFKKELTANEIATGAGISLQLAKYHIEKMQSIGLICVSRVGKNSKSRDMNYYTASKLAIVITHTDVAEKARQSKLLAKSLKSIYRLFGVGGAAVASILSIMLTRIEGNSLPELGWAGGAESRSMVPNSVDESVYLAQKKIDAVISNPSSGSGTPFFDPYSGTIPFDTGELAITMIMLAAIGLALSLPFFARSWRKDAAPACRAPCRIQRTQIP